ncbi:ANK3 [Symbiodinium sp. KB8]|nr:ANK3 [Symbiodinium sp. KB8]
MLCVSQVSGGSVLELGPDEFDALTSSGGSAVRALKERVRWATGIGIFRQSLVRHGCVLEENDKLDFPMDLQLVVTPCLTKMSAQDFEEMHRAVCVGDVHRLEAVLQKGHDPDAKDTEHRTALHKAAFGTAALHSRIAKAGCALLLIEARAGLDIKDSVGSTPLHIALNEKNLQVAGLLIEARAGLDIKDSDGSTPVQSALKEKNLELAGLLISAGAGISGAQREAFEPGNLEVANFMLQAGIDVNEPGDDGRTPLHWVCRCGHLMVLQVLLEARASMNVTDSRNATPLFLAADSGKVDTVQMLIQGEADLNQATASGTNALQIALGNRRLDIARLLVEAKAGWSSSPDSHQAPGLLIASEQLDWYMVRLLLDARASLDAVDALGRTALHHAFLNPQDVESMDMARLLIERTADVNKTLDAEGCAPLHWMSQAGRSDEVPFLVKAKADPNQKNSKGETSLHLASRSGHHEVVRQLLENGAETNLADARGRTPLLRAAELGHPEAVSLLLAYRADVGWADADSFTPLLEAAGRGNFECTRLLIQAGADVNRASLLTGATPLQIAQKHDKHAVARLLTDAGASGAASAGYLGK